MRKILKGNFFATRFSPSVPRCLLLVLLSFLLRWFQITAGLKESQSHSAGWQARRNACWTLAQAFTCKSCSSAVETANANQELPALLTKISSLPASLQKLPAVLHTTFYFLVKLNYHKHYLASSHFLLKTKAICHSQFLYTSDGWLPASGISVFFQIISIRILKQYSFK